MPEPESDGSKRAKRPFWSDRLALGVALLGMALMVLALLWRINPVEGSVVPAFLTGNPLGVCLFWLLFVGCMPAWILGVALCLLLPLPEDTRWLLARGVMLLLQGLGYFLIGKGVSRVLLKRRDPR